MTKADRFRGVVRTCPPESLTSTVAALTATVAALELRVAQLEREAHSHCQRCQRETAPMQYGCKPDQHCKAPTATNGSAA